MKMNILKKSVAALSISATCFYAMNAMANEGQVNTEHVKQAQELAKKFGGQLKPELQKAMKAGGPVAAVEVCHSKAPAIAAALAKESGWQITRVSLKPRGANATPDAWETKVLEKFNAQKEAGTKPKDIQFSEVINTDNGSQFRYMKAVGTGGVCLACHGAKVSEPVKQALAKYYPNDKAMGYSKGDIRGAFSFTKDIK